jgi:CheY-like chemotaxis protein
MSEVKRASERAATLTRQLLTFSRQETLQPAHLNLNDVIADLMKMLRRVIGEHVELVVHAQPGLRPVFADPGQIEQVILNLCINARDAMPRGGRLSIETENATPDSEFIREHPWAEDDDYVFLRVTDTGEGIPENVRARIFEPFYTTKEVGQGTGLGLATVYAIAERHGGGIVVESEPGRGATFRFYLPARNAPPDLEDEESFEIEPPGGTERILLAEDDEAVRSLVVSLLSEAGYELLVAGDGDEAIRIFRAHADEIQLVLADVIMPKKGGREVYAEVKALRPLVPILFTTGYSFNALDRERLPESSGEIIRKPYAPNELLRRVRDALDGTNGP